MSQALKHPGLISLAAGFVDNETLPCEATAQTLTRMAANSQLLRQALQYDTSAGSMQLRHRLAKWAYRNWPDVDNVSPDRLVLTAGSNQLLHLVAEATIDPGDIVLAASPTYFVYMGTLRAMEARVIGVQADENGMCMQALKQALDRIVASGDADRVRAIYCVTDFDNPAGSTLSLERREQLLSIVKQWRSKHGRLLVISDTAYQELRYEGDELPPLLAIDPQAADFVIEAGTFSKSFSPGIRVGWGVVPESIFAPLLELKSNIDFGAPHFSQLFMNEILRAGEIERHLPVIRQHYQLKRDVMLEALEAELRDIEGISWRRPKGGLYVWLVLPAEVDASEEGTLWQRATDLGVLYVPGHYCFPAEGEPVQRNSIRLSFGVQSPDRIRSGIRLLAQAIRQELAL